MICEEDRVDSKNPHVLLFTSDPVYLEQTKGIIVRTGGAVKVILLLCNHIKPGIMTFLVF